MSLPIVFETPTPVQTLILVQNSGKIHCKHPKNTMFKGVFNEETKQLEGETINIAPDLKTKFKTFKKRLYAAKMLRLKRIHRKLASKIQEIRTRGELLEQVY